MDAIDELLAVRSELEQALRHVTRARRFFAEDPVLLRVQRDLENKTDVAEAAYLDALIAAEGDRQGG